LPIALLWIGGISAFIGVAGDRIIPWDLFLLLDGAWRILQGQRPHTDFYTAVGPIIYMVSALGLWLTGLDVRGIGLANGIMGVGLGLWGWRLARSRVGVLPAAMLSIGVAILIVTPRPIDYPFNIVSPASSFNRYGYAMLALVMIEVFPLKTWKRQMPRQIWLGGASTGTLCALLLFLKVTYGLGAVCLLIMGLAVAGFERARVVSLILLFAVTTLAMLAYLRFDMFRILSDYRIAAGARAVPTYQITQAIVQNAPFFLALFLIAIAGTYFFTTRFQSLKDRLYVSCITLAIWICGTCISITNTHCPAFHLAAFFALVLGDWLATSTALQEVSVCTNVRRLLLVPLLCIAAFPVIIDGASLIYSMLPLRNPAQRVIAHLPEKHLEKYLAVSGSLEGNRGTEYFVEIEDGVQLLRRYSRSTDSVMTLDFTNAFAFTLLRPVVRGGTPWMQYGYQFTETSKPDAAWLYGNSACIMVAKKSMDWPWSYEALLRTYMPFVESHFQRFAESQYWVLYRHR
jgi:hypothetical protein